MGLHVGVLDTENLLGAVDGQLLGDIHVLAAAVPALGRVALGVFVGEHRALCLHDGRAGEILAGDQLDVFLLAAGLGPDHLCDLGIDGVQPPGSRGDIRLHLVHPPLVAAAVLEPGLDERVEDALGQGLIRCGGPEAEDVRVVVLAGEPGCLLVMRKRGPDAGHLVGAHAHADTGVADQQAKPALPAGHGLAHLTGEVRVVGLVLRVTPEVGVRDAFFAKVMTQDLLEPVAGVVCAEGHFHHRLRRAGDQSVVFLDGFQK